MKCLGFRHVRISSLKLPGGMRAVREELATAEIQSSYQWTGGVPAEPVLVDSDMNLRAGKHRVAACMNLKRETVPAMVFEGTPEELERLTDIENAYRSHNPEARDAALARLVGKIEKTVPEGGSAKPPVGRPITPRGQAVREVAKATGTTPAAVKSAVARVEARQRAEEEPGTPEPIVARVVLESWGLPIPEDIQRGANAADIALRELRAMVAQAQRSLAEAKRQTGKSFLRLEEGLKQAAYECNAELPVAVCFACKALPAVRPRCMTCYQHGYVGRELVKTAAPELKERGAQAGVYIEGRWYSVEQARRLKP